MGYFSDFYLESFSTQVTKEFVILLNQIQIHNKEKYLLIVAQDMETCKITRLIDFHGKKYDLYKYQEKWANLNKGDVIKVDCIFHESINSVNVLRVVSDYELIISYDYYNKIKEKTELGGELDLRKNDEQFNESNISYLLPKKTDLEYLSKKLRGRYGFALYQLEDTKLIQYTTKNKTIKYQFVVKGAGNLISYADIVSYVKDIDIRIGDLYTGFALIEFKFQNGRLRLKVHDFLNEDENFKEPMNLKDINPFGSVSDDDLPF